MIQLIITALCGLVVGGVICFPLGIRYRKNVSEKEISSAEEEGKRIVNEAIKSAESKKREALLEAKEEILKNRSEYEKEVKERRADLQRQENRLQQKEENLDKKTENLERKEETLQQKIADLEKTREEIDQIKERQMAELKRMEAHILPEDMDYSSIDGLRLEARQKLAAIRPRNLGQAGRISGVSPADLTALMIWLGTHGKASGPGSAAGPEPAAPPPQ